MFSENKDLEIFERYFAGNLTKEEQTLFNTSMVTDPEFKESLEYFGDFMVGVEAFGDKQVMLQLQALEKAIQKEENQAASQNQSVPQQEGILQQLFDKASYTLDQLAGLFRPLPNYQSLLIAAHRGSKIPLQKPDGDWDLAISPVELKFSKPTSEDLPLVIENNQRKSVWIATVPENSIAFTIRMEDTMIDMPGRYYLKLSNGKETILHEIFVHKNWMQ